MKRKKFLSSLFCIALILTLVSALAVAASALSGSGTNDDPYLITSVSDFAQMNGSDKVFKLTKDISFGGADPGVDSFSGHLYGEGKKITGLINYALVDENSGTIQDLVIENPSFQAEMSSNYKTGDATDDTLGLKDYYVYHQHFGFAAGENTGLIDNVCVTGATVNAYIEDHVVAVAHVGLITAWNNGGTIINATVKNSNLTVCDPAGAVGLIAGENTSGTIAYSVVKDNTIKKFVHSDRDESNTFNATWLSSVGTVVGYAKQLSLFNCYICDNACYNADGSAYSYSVVGIGLADDTAYDPTYVTGGGNKQTISLVYVNADNGAIINNHGLLIGYEKNIVDNEDYSADAFNADLSASNYYPSAYSDRLLERDADANTVLITSLAGKIKVTGLTVDGSARYYNSPTNITLEVLENTSTYYVTYYDNWTATDKATGKTTSVKVGDTYRIEHSTDFSGPGYYYLGIKNEVQIGTSFTPTYLAAHGSLSDPSFVDLGESKLASYIDAIKDGVKPTYQKVGTSTTTSTITDYGEYIVILDLSAIKNNSATSHRVKYLETQGYTTSSSTLRVWNCKPAAASNFTIDNPVNGYTGSAVTAKFSELDALGISYTVYYNGSTTAPSALGEYTVTIDVGEYIGDTYAESWSETKGLNVGKMKISNEGITVYADGVKQLEGWSLTYGSTTAEMVNGLIPIGSMSSGTEYTLYYTKDGTKLKIYTGTYDGNGKFELNFATLTVVSASGAVSFGDVEAVSPYSNISTERFKLKYYAIVGKPISDVITADPKVEIDDTTLTFKGWIDPATEKSVDIKTVTVPASGTTIYATYNAYVSDAASALGLTVGETYYVYDSSGNISTSWTWDDVEYKNITGGETFIPMIYGGTYRTETYGYKEEGPDVSWQYAYTVNRFISEKTYTNMTNIKSLYMYQYGTGVGNIFPYPSPLAYLAHISSSGVTYGVTVGGVMDVMLPSSGTNLGATDANGSYLTVYNPWNDRTQLYLNIGDRAKVLGNIEPTRDIPENTWYILTWKDDFSAWNGTTSAGVLAASVGSNPFAVRLVGDMSDTQLANSAAVKLNFGDFAATATKSINVILQTSSGKYTFLSEEILSSYVKDDTFPYWRGNDGNYYMYGDSIPATVTTLTASTISLDKLTQADCDTHGLSYDYVGYYGISSEQHLLLFSQLLQDDANADSKAVLLRDLDLSSTTLYSMDKLTGILDGNGNKITGLKVNLFGTFRGTMKNITFVSPTVAVVGTSSGTVNYIGVRVENVSLSYSTGGGALTNDIASNTTVRFEDCYLSGSLTATSWGWNVGGFAYIKGSRSNVKIEFLRCHCAATLTPAENRKFGSNNYRSFVGALIADEYENRTTGNNTDPSHTNLSITVRDCLASGDAAKISYLVVLDDSVKGDNALIYSSAATGAKLDTVFSSSFTQTACFKYSSNSMREISPSRSMAANAAAWTMNVQEGGRTNAAVFSYEGTKVVFADATHYPTYRVIFTDGTNSYTVYTNAADGYAAIPSAADGKKITYTDADGKTQFFTATTRVTADTTVTIAEWSDSDPITETPVFTSNTYTRQGATPKHAEFTLSKAPADDTVYRVYSDAECTTLAGTVSASGTVLTLALNSDIPDGVTTPYYITAQVTGKRVSTAAAVSVVPKPELTLVYDATPETLYYGLVFDFEYSFKLGGAAFTPDSCDVSFTGCDSLGDGKYFAKSTDDVKFTFSIAEGEQHRAFSEVVTLTGAVRNLSICPMTVSGASQSIVKGTDTVTEPVFTFPSTDTAVSVTNYVTYTLDGSNYTLSELKAKAKTLEIGTYNITYTLSAWNSYVENTQIGTVTLEVADFELESSIPETAVHTSTWGEIFDTSDFALKLGSTTVSGVTYKVQLKDGGAWKDVNNATAPAEGEYAYQVLATMTYGGTVYTNRVVKTGKVTVARIEITVSGITAIDRVYSGTDNKSVVMNVTSAVLTGKVNGDDLAVSATGTVENGNAGNGKTVTISLELTGDDVDKYKLAASGQQTETTVNITKKAITVTGVTAKDKDYDGNTTATADTSAADLEGNLDGANLTLTAGVATFSDKNAAEDKTVTFSGFALDGTAKDNYYLSAQPASVKATIDPLKVDVTVSGNATYTYTGKADYTHTATYETVGGDTADVTVYYDGETEKPVTVKYDGGVKAYAITVTVNDANYELDKTEGTTAFTVEQAPISVASAVVSDKTYDTTTDATATAVTFSGLQNGEALTLDTDFTAVATFRNANADDTALADVTVTLNDTDKAHNYVLAVNATTATAKIAQKSITVTGVTAKDKDYDGNTTATADTSAADLEGNLDGANLTLTAGVATFSDKNAAEDKTVTFSGFALDGTAKDNYYLSAQPASVKATIDPLKVDVTVSGSATYTYTGNADYTHTATYETVGGDTADVTVYYDGETEKPVTVKYDGGVKAYAITVTVTDANYELGSTNGTTAFTVEQAPISVESVTVSDKTYDTTTNVTVTEVKLQGLQNEEELYRDSDYTVTASFRDANVAEEVTADVEITLIDNANTRNYKWADGTANKSTDTAKISTWDISGTLEVTVIGENNSDGTADIGETVKIVGVAPESALTSNSVTWTWSFDGAEGVVGTDSVEVTADNLGDTILVTATGTGNYSGTLSTASYRIGARTLSGTITATGTTALGETLTATLTSTSGEPVLDSDYRVQWHRVAADGTTTVIEGAAALTYTLTEADIGKSVRVELISDFGKASVFTGTLTKDTVIPPTAPAVPVITAKAMSKAVTVSWKAPFNGGRDITGYSLAVTDADGNPIEVSPVEIGAEATSYKVAELKNNVVYTFVLTATNEVGSTPSLAVTAKPNAISIIIAAAGGKDDDDDLPPVPTTPAEPTHVCPSEHLTDVNKEAWYHLTVDYVVENKLMVGTKADKFSPDGNITRGMVATLLWRMEGSPVVNYLMTFEDVPSNAYYAEAIRWAASEGIVLGHTARKFAPDDNITREQLCAMLYRYVQYGGGGFTGSWMFLLEYTDRADVSEWAYESVCYMTMHGIVNGRSNGTLDPKGTATRAETAQIIKNYLEE